MRLCSLSSTFAVLCTQQRCARVWGYTSAKADQNPSPPSPTASYAAFTPRSCRFNNTASTGLAFFKYGSNKSEEKHRPAPLLSRVRGTRTRTGPIPVEISRDGK